MLPTSDEGVHFARINTYVVIFTNLDDLDARNNLLLESLLYQKPLIRKYIYNGLYNGVY